MFSGKVFYNYMQDLNYGRGGHDADPLHINSAMMKVSDFGSDTVNVVIPLFTFQRVREMI